MAKISSRAMNLTRQSIWYNGHQWQVVWETLSTMVECVSENLCIRQDVSCEDGRQSDCLVLDLEYSKFYF